MEYVIRLLAEYAVLVGVTGQVRRCAGDFGVALFQSIDTEYLLG
jgi:hypothetical protein